MLSPGPHRCGAGICSTPQVCISSNQTDFLIAPEPVQSKSQPHSTQAHPGARASLIKYFHDQTLTEEDTQRIFNTCSRMQCINSFPTHHAIWSQSRPSQPVCLPLDPAAAPLDLGRTTLPCLPRYEHACRHCLPRDKVLRRGCTNEGTQSW